MERLFGLSFVFLCEFFAFFFGGGGEAQLAELN